MAGTSVVVKGVVKVVTKEVPFVVEVPVVKSVLVEKVVVVKKEIPVIVER